MHISQTPWVSPHYCSMKPGDRQGDKQKGAELGMHLILLDSRAPHSAPLTQMLCPSLAREGFEVPVALSPVALSSTQAPLSPPSTHNLPREASNSEPDRPRLKARPHWTPRSSLSTLNLSFLVCKMGTVISAISVWELTKIEHFPKNEEMRETSWAHGESD